MLKKLGIQNKVQINPQKANYIADYGCTIYGMW